jgi:hypothetical protein
MEFLINQTLSSDIHDHFPALSKYALQHNFHRILPNFTPEATIDESSSTDGELIDFVGGADLFVNARLSTTDRLGNAKLGAGLMSGPEWYRFVEKKQCVKLQTNATVMQDITETELDRCSFWADISPRTLV